MEEGNLLEEHLEEILSETNLLTKKKFATMANRGINFYLDLLFKELKMWNYRLQIAECEKPPNCHEIITNLQTQQRSFLALKSALYELLKSVDSQEGSENFNFWTSQQNRENVKLFFDLVEKTGEVLKDSVSLRKSLEKKEREDISFLVDTKGNEFRDLLTRFYSFCLYFFRIQDIMFLEGEKKKLKEIKKVERIVVSEELICSLPFFCLYAKKDFFSEPEFTAAEFIKIENSLIRFIRELEEVKIYALSSSYNPLASFFFFFLSETRVNYLKCMRTEDLSEQYKFLSRLEAGILSTLQEINDSFFIIFKEKLNINEFETTVEELEELLFFNVQDQN